MKKLVFPAFFLVLYLLIYFILYKIYMPRVSAFGCFDDCFSYAAGYFINKGEILYSQIFYNHQFFPAYISSFLQNFTSPINLYDLVLKHRQFVFIFGFFFNLLLIFRFKKVGFLFVIFYEFSKFYIFGDRFLGEGLVVYPVVYLTLFILEMFYERKIYGFDFILSAIFLWFSFFTRESFTFLYILYGFLIFIPLNKFGRIKFFSLLIFTLLIFLTVFLTKINFNDYIFNLYTVNKSFFGQINFFEGFFSPVYLLTGKDWNIFRILITGLDIILILIIINLFLKKKFKVFVFVLTSLFLANLRPIPPGRIFYDAFHIIPYFGIMLAIIFFLLTKLPKRLQIPTNIFLFILFCYFILNPLNFIYEKVNPHLEFLNNYQSILISGEKIKSIAKPGDTLFVDGFDEVIYWVSGLPSSYKYSMYTSFMPQFKKYSGERLKMFEENPPNIYYGSCPGEKNKERLLPSKFRNLYKNISLFGKSSCIFKYDGEE